MNVAATLSHFLTCLKGKYFYRKEVDALGVKLGTGVHEKTLLNISRTVQLEFENK
jgi:hypothetical protein